MAVTISVISIDDKFFTIEATNESGGKILKTPVLLKQRTKKSIESVIKKEFKAFESPVWGGYSVVYMVKVV